MAMVKGRKFVLYRICSCLPISCSPDAGHLQTHCRGLAIWSSTKDLALESALSRNRRWIVNNQIKHFLLRHPDRTASVHSLQKKFKTLDLQGRALNWLQKYPCCFEILHSPDGSDHHFRFSKRMASLVDEEQAIVDSQEQAFICRLTKLLMLSRGCRLPVTKLNAFKRSLGLPDDYLLRILPNYPNTFRLTNLDTRHSSMELELVDWNPALAVSTIEYAATQLGEPPQFQCSLPSSWIRTREKFDEFNNRTPYISPYKDDDGLDPEKRSVGILHEVLSLTLWKKASIVKLEHFKREFGLTEQLNLLLLRHPCIFYVSNRYKIYTVILREAYKESVLIDKDPLVVVKDKFGELMQEGVHEYNKRHQLANIEKKRRRGEMAAEKKKEEVEEEDSRLQGENMMKMEERKRFYKVLFDENP